MNVASRLGVFGLAALAAFGAAAAIGSAVGPIDVGADSGAVPESALTTEVDGYTVALAAQPKVGAATLDFAIANLDARDLDAAHLVIIHQADFGYLLAQRLADPDALRFATDFATPGDYRLFLEFSADGTVHVANFTVNIGPSSATDHESHTP